MNIKNKKTNQTLEDYLPNSELIEHYISRSGDPRSLTAKRFYEEVPFGIVKVHKTTRAGATVALCSESVRRRQLFTFIPRTNRIISKTVKEDVANVVGHSINVIQIYRNSFCPRIAERIKRHPSIEKLGFIPLPKCDSCETTQCPIREAYETSVEKIDGFCLTYAKLQSLVLSESKRAKSLLDKITSNSRNIIFDEVQTLQEGTTVSVPIWGVTKGYEWNFNLQPYAKLKESSPLLQTFLDKIAEIIEVAKPKVEKLKNESFKDHHLKHLTAIVENPAYKRNIERMKEIQAKEQIEREKQKSEFEREQALHPNETYIETALRLPETPKQTIPKAMQEIQREDIPFSDIVKIQEIIINAIEDSKEYGLKEDQIIALSKLLMIVNSTFFTVSFTRNLDGQQITLQALDTLLFQSMKTFIAKTLQKSSEKRVIFTTATFGSLKLDKLLGLPVIKNWNWGDPMNTSSKLLLVADKARISPFNFKFKLESMIKLIKAIMARFGQENIGICTMNKEWSADLARFGIKSTWYQSDETEGVSSKKRIWIFIGIAHKPVNAKGHLAIVQASYHENPLNLQGEDFLYYVSQKLRLESVNINTYQAISRAKDPEAKDRSLAIMIGARADDVEKCLLWGPTRNLKPEKSDKGLKFTVEVQDPIGKPSLTIAPLGRNIDESMHIFDQWINYGEVDSYQLNWVYLKKFIDEKGYVSVKQLTKNNGLSEISVREFFNRLPAFFERLSVINYVLLHDSDGKIKGVSTRQFYENKKVATTLKQLIRPVSVIQTNDWFIALKAAVDRSPDHLTKLNPAYFSQHVSSTVYLHLNEFMDALELKPQLCPGWVVLGKKTDGRNNRWLALDLPCLGAWAPDYPRSFGNPYQSRVDNATDLMQMAILGGRAKGECFISVYPSPEHKHSKDGANPVISTIFIDMDIDADEFDVLKKQWEKEKDTACLRELISLRFKLMGDVLKQAKAVVEYLKSLDIEPRVLLSGGKGVHMFVDFPSVEFSSPQVAKDVIKKFLEQIADGASKKSGCKVTFDPCVIGDLSRLCRIPNTHNSKATKILGRDQYAVPVTVEEIINLTPSEYDNLCLKIRYLPVQRKESLGAFQMLSKICQEIDFEEDDSEPNRRPTFTPKSSVKDPKRIEEYERECSREILADVDFDELDVRPCFKRVHSERDSLNGGNGHMMRIGAVMELAAKGLSISSIVRWFSFCNDYNERISEKAVVDLISRGFTDKHMADDGSERRKGLKCKTIEGYGFCLKDDCHIYRRKFGREVK